MFFIKLHQNVPLSKTMCKTYNSTQLHRLKAKATPQDHAIYPLICVRSIPPEPFERFSINLAQMFFL